MRKTAAILFMGVFLYNCLGYRVLFSYLQHHADIQSEARFDREEYDESRLIELKVPLNLPYISNWNEFERIDGEIELKGKHYKYIKRKVYHDSLILLCLPDEYKQKLEKDKGDFFELVNGIENSTKNTQEKSNTSFLKSLLIEYQREENNWEINSFLNYSQLHFINNSDEYSSVILNTPHQPPNHCC